MEVRFETKITENYSTCLSISKIESGVFISILKLNTDDNSEELLENHFLNKEDLKDFIGALLHIQSKLNR